MAGASTSRSKRTFAQTTERGVKAHELAMRDRAVIEPRLEPGTIDGLGTDLLELGVRVPGATQAQTARSAATETQYAALARLASRIGDIRTAVKTNLPKASFKAWGVGTEVHDEVVSSVVAATNTILTRKDQAPDEARQAGLLSEDFTQLEALLAAAQSADAAQERTKAAAPAATRARNATQRRIERAIKKIAAAGRMAFPEIENPPTDYARFDYDALLGGTSRKAASKATTTTNPT